MPFKMFFNNKVRATLFVLILVLLSRVLVFWIFDQWEIVNDSGVAVKPLGEPAYLDYGLYQKSIGSAWNEIFRPFIFLHYAWTNITDALVWLRGQPLKPGPIFPTLLNVWNYDINHAPLAWAYLIMGILIGLLWAMFIAWRNMGLGLQILIACFPALVYYSFLISTDLLYVLLIALFYATAWAALLRSRWALFCCMGILVVALLTRPNALAMIPVLYFVITFDKILKWRTKLICMLFFGLLGVYMLIYYLPYFWIHEGNSAHTHYWGIYPKQFNEGLFSGWPSWLNKSISFVLYAVSKVIYSVGLRPSYADISPWLVIARSWPGVLLLPGLVYGLWRGQWFDRIFVFFFLMPVYVGAAQERYLLAITPLLLLWGIQAYSLLGQQVAYRIQARGAF